MLEVTRGKKVVIAVDYFTRKIFARVIATKEAHKICETIEKILKEFKIETLVSDNGREFKNFKVAELTNRNGINHRFSIPYYHQSNGRVERAIKTIRNGLRKEQGPLKKRLTTVVKNHNDTVHRAIGMTSNDALKQENWPLIKESIEKYKKEFDRKNFKMECFKPNTRVLIRKKIERQKWKINLIKKALWKKRYTRMYTKCWALRVI